MCKLLMKQKNKIAENGIQHLSKNLAVTLKVTYYNPCSINTGGGLFLSIWVLLTSNHNHVFFTEMNMNIHNLLGKAAKSSGNNLFWISDSGVYQFVHQSSLWVILDPNLQYRSKHFLA